MSSRNYIGKWLGPAVVLVMSLLLLLMVVAVTLILSGLSSQSATPTTAFKSCLVTTEFLETAENLSLDALVQGLNKTFDLMSEMEKPLGQEWSGQFDLTNLGPAGMVVVWTNTLGQPFKVLRGTSPPNVWALKMRPVSPGGFDGGGVYLVSTPGLGVPTPGRSAGLCSPVNVPADSPWPAAWAVSVQ